LRKLILVLILSTTAYTALAQNSNEIGLTGGVSYYLGDVNHSIPFYSSKPAFGINYRMNMNDRYALKASLSQLIIAADDADFSSGYQQSRNYSFKNRMYELNTVCEFNFLEYDPANYYRYTPYITAGVAVLYEQETGKILTPSIPFGLGYKYSPNNKFSISAEWVHRKTFTDELDGLFYSEVSSELNTDYKQITDRNGKDWYSSFTIMIGYNITSDKIRCSAYPGITRRYR